MEVFPALVLASLQAAFFGRLAAPRYNPARHRTFKLADWASVAEAAADEAERLGCVDLASYCRGVALGAKPAKVDQDKLDAALCALIAVRWRRRSRQESLLLGGLDSGYMVLPVIPEVRLRLSEPARKANVPIDGRIPQVRV